MNCPQFVDAGLIILDDRFDCEEVLPFLTTFTLEAILGGGGPSSTCTVRAVKRCVKGGSIQYQ